MNKYDNLMLRAAALAMLSGLGASAVLAQVEQGTLDEIIVTAQKRPETLQTAAISVTAITGASLEAARILNMEDLAHAVTGLSFTTSNPDSKELNIRGVVTAGLASPSADQSVATFVDDVYVGRSNILDYNFYDIARIEIVRGPQGVLLGKNVAAGAINVIANSPEAEPAARITTSLGNYDLRQVNAYITGPITDELSGRASVQTINHSGYARDILHNTDLENLDSQQARLQLAFAPHDSDFRGNLIVDYSEDDSDGINRVGVLNPSMATGIDIWAAARADLAAIRGYLSPRESLPVWPTYAGNKTPTPQGSRLQMFSGIMKLEKDVFPNIRLTSISGYREGHVRTLFDQTGFAINNGYGIITPLLFSEPVNITETSPQVTQEMRLASNDANSRLNWIVGAYYLHSDVHNQSTLWGESTVLPILSGQSHFDDTARIETEAAFAQLSYRFFDRLELDVGARYTEDKKHGGVTGTAVTLGPGGVALTPLAVVPGFTTPYGAKWNKTTPQGTLKWTANDYTVVYATVSQGFKGGGFQGSPANAFAASLPYNPETVTNYEVGYKSEFFDRTLRWNSAMFEEKYRDLQVQQTNAACLCNIIGNAAFATIKGVETDIQYAPTSSFRAWISGTYLHAKYDQFAFGGVDNSGHYLQRTPKYQLAPGIEAATNLGSWEKALSAQLSYHYQGKMYWDPANDSYEKAYGTLDARISLTPPQKNWAISIWGKNVTNTLYRTTVIPFLQDEVGSYAAPRTYGVDLTAYFK